jgi:sugar O-acyltransferase (sialic acid O-acetyltransferase NeuD family)
MNVIFGVAGFAKEVDWLIHDMYVAGIGDYRTDLYVSEPGNALAGSDLHGIPVLAEDAFFSKYQGQSDINCFIGIGSPAVREKIVGVIRRWNPACRFPTVIHPLVSMDRRPGRVRFGEGCVVCSGNTLTTDIVVGDFVHINLDCSVGHDATIGAFSTLSPGVQMSGNVHLGARCFVGTGANLIEHVTLAADVVVGAGACVAKSLEEAGTYVGVPVKKIK